ncbi:MAG: hypothetical protein ABIR84_05090 [Candidatus Nitrotoga sp.]
MPAATGQTEWLQYLRQFDCKTSRDKAPRQVGDYYETQASDHSGSVAGKHPRFQAHFTSTSAALFNMTECSFNIISTSRLERVVLRSVPEVFTTIKE